MINYYVDYISEKNNPIISGRSKNDPSMYILKNLGEGFYEINPLAPNGKWPSRFKYYRDIESLIPILDNDERLLVKLNEDELNQVAPENLIVDNVPTIDASKVGTKTFLAPYDYKFSDIPKKFNKYLETVVLLKLADEDIYNIKDVAVITEHIDERRKYINDGFGGYSDLYKAVKHPAIVDKYADDLFEFTVVSPNRWAVTKVPTYMEGKRK